MLHRVVREHLATFLEEARARSAHGFGLPGFVEREFRDYLGCGVLARGFARVRCESCGDEHLVGFSCKRRGVCPSCTSRRAVDAAAHLVDAVLPLTPMRQWVLSFPIKVRWMLARRPALVGRVLAVFLRALSTWQRRRGRSVGVCGATGSVTFVQRFGSALQLTVHFHAVLPDGVFVRGDDGCVSFQRLPSPDDEDVEALVRQCASRVLRLLRRELDDDEPEADALAALEAASLAASLKARPAANADGPKKKRLTAFLEGFSLHVLPHGGLGEVAKRPAIAAAGVHLHENDRHGLEQLCRYGARGAIALSRLSELPDGRVAYHMKRPLPALHGRPGERAKLAAIGGCDGRTHLVLTGVELLRKLAPLIPPPRQHLLRFHGVFAPNAKLRSQVVPKPPAPVVGEGAPSDQPRVRPSPSPYRLDWSAALKRVFGLDILACARCGGRLVVLAFIEKLSAVKAILDHLGLPSVPLPLGKARGPPQVAWGF
ncbi:MAG: transposase [Deltaproteobacteria bacterium]|nr:transposase [Deltaproteobacteria bacterium]